MGVLRKKHGNCDASKYIDVMGRILGRCKENKAYNVKKKEYLACDNYIRKISHLSFNF